MNPNKFQSEANTISRVQELDALLDGTILRAAAGVWVKNGDYFFAAGIEEEFTSAELAEFNSLAIVWLPKAAREQA